MMAYIDIYYLLAWICLAAGAIGLSAGQEQARAARIQRVIDRMRQVGSGWRYIGREPGAPAPRQAERGPTSGASHINPHVMASDPPTIAGASDRAGFIDAPEIGPANSTSKAITPPIATPANSPFSCGPEATAFRTTNIRIAGGA